MMPYLVGFGVIVAVAALSLATAGVIAILALTAAQSVLMVVG